MHREPNARARLTGRPERSGRNTVNEQEIVKMVDEALERFGTRDLVSGAEILDFLLDLRNTALVPDPLEELLEQESAPAIT
ncbi:MAG: hypothetical protein ACXW1S_07015 [Acidimicrobiia bacterium]